MAKNKSTQHLQNFKDDKIINDIDKIVKDSKNSDVRYFSRSDFIEIACKKLILSHRTQKTN